ncbi:hypothetical protein GOV10_01170, partial [Candidatus Woesearchaeota archaeon]|nr:hypothetical protein [Candidatus Woesearchaeota archaeon]
MTQLTHHAYILTGDSEKSLLWLHSWLEDEGVSIHGNPDFWHGEFETFGINDAKQLRELQSRKAVGDGRKIYIVSSTKMTREAQSALLKVLEEPTKGAHIFLIVPHEESLLPTLRSRMIVLNRDWNTKEDADALARDILSATPAKRLTLVEPFIKEKNIAMVRALCNSLEH